MSEYEAVPIPPAIQYPYPYATATRLGEYLVLFPGEVATRGRTRVVYRDNKGDFIRSKGERYQVVQTVPGKYAPWNVIGVRSRTAEEQL